MLISSLVLAVSFTGIATARLKSLPESVSSLVYVFRDRWLWTLWMWAVALLTLIPTTDLLSRIGMEFLGFGTMVCLMFCGSMPLFDKEHVRWHWITGVSGCILSQLCVLMICPWWLLMWLLMVFVALCCIAGYNDTDDECVFQGKGVFLAECICYVSLMGAMITAAPS